MTFAQRQRAALVRLLEELGPFAPTKCDGWQTQDLAAHLYVRENKPAALPGIGSERFAAHTARIQNHALHSLGFPALVDAIRTPGWVMRPLDKLVNTSEFFIHHEDVLRANGRSQTLTPEEQQELWAVVRVLARKAHVKFGGRAIVTRLDSGKDCVMGQGDRPIHVEGMPSEFLLHLSGRDADVKLTGEPAAVEKWHAAIGGL